MPKRKQVVITGAHRGGRGTSKFDAQTLTIGGISVLTIAAFAAVIYVIYKFA